MRGSWFVLVLALPLVLHVAAINGAQATKTQARTTVVVCDKIGLDSATLAVARDQVTRIFEAAGVEIVWIDSTGGRTPATFAPASLEECEIPSVEGDFLAIVSNETPKRFSREALGWSDERTPSPQKLYVFYPRVKAAAAKGANSNAGVVLGAVIVHEIGHLLLPAKTHFPDGIMRASWGYRQIREAAQGVLQFNSAQAESIRGELQSKAQPRFVRADNPRVLTSAR